MNLEELGIDIDDLKEQIINNASNNIVSSLKRDIKEEILKNVRSVVSQKINDLVTETLGDIYQPIDSFGEPKGEKTTLREVFKKSCTDWWNEFVDKSGNPCNEYHGQKRYIMVAKEITGKVLSESLSPDLYQIAKDGKKQIEIGIKENIKEYLDNIFKQ